MRFRCPQCTTWQPMPAGAADGPREHSCGQCGALLTLTPEEAAEGPRIRAEVRPEAEVALAGEDPLLALCAESEGQSPAARAEELTGVRAQLVALITGASPRLWLPSAALVAVGLLVGVGALVVGQRVERSLSLLLAPLALGVVAWSMVLAASAVANLLHIRLAGQAVGVGRSLRMILEHGNGAVGSALRFVAIGVIGATLCGLLALLGTFPGLAGDGGLALTGALLWLQLLAVAAGLGFLAWMALALLLHPGLAASTQAPAGRLFGFVFGLLRSESRDVMRRGALPLGAALVQLLVGWWVLRTALGAAVALNARILGARYADLIAASPVRVLFGAPELLDPGASLSAGGLLMALSLALAAAAVLGYVASFLGASGYLLARGLDLPARLEGRGRRSR